MLILLKARVAAYTKKDGTFVAEHTDKRPAAKRLASNDPRKPAQLPLLMRDATGGDEVVAYPYASGMSHKRDMAAAVESPAGLGTVVQELSNAAMDRIADAIAEGKPTFVDSGAFPAFKRAMKAGKPEEARLDFEKVFAKYNELSRRVQAKAPEYSDNSLLMIVAPDVVGDQETTLSLIEEHREQIMQWIEAGHEVIVPFQRGPIDQYVAYLRVRDALEDLPFVVGIPSAAAAMTTQDVIDLVSHDYKPDRLHILGAVQSDRYHERMQVIRDHYADQVPGVTTDGNVMRSKLYELGGLKGQVKFDKIKEILARVVPEHYGGTRLAKAGLDGDEPLFVVGPVGELPFELEADLSKTLVHEHTRKDGVRVEAYERKPMYVSRKVLNGQAVHDWAKGAGFKNVVPADKMHVTVAYSKTPVHHGSVDPHQGTVAAKPQRIGLLGDGTDHVLHMDHPKLQERFKHMLGLGASWDHDTANYQPHVTISYKDQGADLTGVAPFKGPIELGPEVVEDLKEGWGKQVTDETAFEDDMTRQAAWLDERSKEAGFEGVEDLLSKDPGLFGELAASWRDENPALAKAIAWYNGRSARAPIALFLKARVVRDAQTTDMFGTHVEQHVRKDGVAQKYHVGRKEKPPETFVKPPALDLPTMEYDGDTWHIQSTGATREDGKVYMHLSSTTRGRQQRNGINPVQASDYFDPPKPPAAPSADPADDGDHPAPLPRRSLAGLSDGDRAKWIRLHRTQHETHYHELGKVRDEMERTRSKKNKAETAMREAETGLAGQQRAPIQDPGRESAFSAAVGANRAEFEKHARKLDELAGNHETLSKLRDELGKQKDAILPGSGDLRSNLMSGQRSSLREELDSQKQFGKQYRDYFKSRGRKKR